jgi:hypothetical protein
MNRYIVQTKELGYFIARFPTREEAIEVVREYEHRDRATGKYEPGFYDIYLEELIVKEAEQ